MKTLYEREARNKNIPAGMKSPYSPVKDIALAHQGSVEMSSTPNVETSFQIRLPVDDRNMK